MTKRRLRYKATPWFLTTEPTPIPSEYICPRDFLSEAKSLSQSISSSQATNHPAHHSTLQQIAKLRQSAESFKRHYFDRFYLHLKREREYQLSSVERVRRQPRKSFRTPDDILPLDASFQPFQNSQQQQQQEQQGSSTTMDSTTGQAVPADRRETLASMAKEMVDSVETHDELMELLGISESSQPSSPNNSSETNGNSEISSANTPIFEQLTRYLISVKRLLNHSKLESFDAKYYNGLHTLKSINLSSLQPDLDSHNFSVSDTSLSNNDFVTVLRISVYNTQKPLSKAQEFLVRGDSYISELRDNLHCVFDHFPLFCQDERKHSGYLFMEGVFYNEDRYDDSIDYSRDIIEWSRLNWSRIGDELRGPNPIVGFTAASLSQTKWQDLSNLRIGYPYIYCHQGNCYHIVMIEEISLLNPRHHSKLLSSSSRTTNRPTNILKTFEKVSNRPTCRYCLEYPVQKIALNDDMAGYYPALFCNKCFEEFHGHADESNDQLSQADYSVYEYHSQTARLDLN